MNTEERVEVLETALEELKQKYSEHWVTPKELATMMKCSVNNVYIKIRAGEIFATDKLGAAIRIPMSQFYKVDKHIPVKKEEKTDISKRKLSMKEIVFGSDDF